MRLISIPGFVVAASLTLTPAAFAGSPDHGPHNVPTVHAATPPRNDGPKTHGSHESGDHGHHGPTPFIDRISANAALVAKLTPLLPSGMSLADAAKGFKNQGQFIAALHVSKNLNIAFDKLKAEMTGPERDSLGQAIHDLAPTADAKSAAKTAEQQAHTDIKTTRPPDTDAD